MLVDKHGFYIYQKVSLIIILLEYGYKKIIFD